MSRPCKERLVERLPEYTCFKPAGIPRRQTGELVLTIEEMEALRLADAEGLDQAAAAEAMAVSKPTFNRIVSSARNKVARALWQGLALRIGGGNYRIGCGNGHRRGHGHCCRRPGSGAVEGAADAKQLPDEERGVE